MAVATIVTAAASLASANPEDFTVKAAGSGNEFKLSQNRGKYVVLHFLLKTECPICLRHTRDYAKKMKEKYPEVVQIFLKPDSEEEISKWAASIPKDQFPALAIYRDPDAKLAKDFGIPHGYKFHGETVHYPAFVLLGPDGKEVFRYVGKSNSDRLSFEQFQQKYTALRAGGDTATTGTASKP